MTHPRSFYIVTTVYPDAGFASAGDAVTHFDEAVDQWIECREADRRRSRSKSSRNNEWNYNENYNLYSRTGTHLYSSLC